MKASWNLDSLRLVHDSSVHGYLSGMEEAYDIILERIYMTRHARITSYNII